MTATRSDLPYCHIADGCEDIRKVDLNLPVGVCRCGACGGNGKYQQHYFEGRSTGECNLCDGMGFRYEATLRPVPFSVTNQIAVANGLTVRHYQAFGLDWRRP